MPPLPLEHRARQQPGASTLVRYFMIPCNICLILLATSTLGFAVLLFLSNCTWLLGVPLFCLLSLHLSLPRISGQSGSYQIQGLMWTGTFSFWVLGRSR